MVKLTLTKQIWSRLLGTGMMMGVMQQANQPLFLEKLASFFVIGSSEGKTAALLSLSLAISTVHQPNQPGLGMIFLPQLGTMLIMLVPILYLFKVQERKEKIELGSKWVWIPMLVLVGIACVRIPYVLITGDTVWGLAKELSSAGYLLCMFTLYVASRRLGLKVFSLMPLFAVLASVGMVVYGFMHQGVRTGGIISSANYDIVTIFILFCVLVSPLKHRWWLSAVAIVGLFFSGAEVAIFALAILFAVILIRRDWSRKLLLPFGALALVLLVCTPMGITQKLYTSAYNRVTALVGVPFADNVVASVPVYDVAGYGIVVGNITQKEALLQEATNLRWASFWVLSPVKPLGYGYNINYFYYPLDIAYGASTTGTHAGGGMGEQLKKAGVTGGIPHNQILIIIEQLGLVALLAWLVVTGRMVMTSGWTYAWIGFLALGVFDHELWTVCAPFWWVLVGVCSTNPIKGKDYIFRANTP